MTIGAERRADHGAHGILGAQTSRTGAVIAGKGRKRARPRPWQTDGGPRPPDPGEQRARACRGKIAHASELVAEQAAIEHEHRFGEAKAVYHCRWCGRWHVGTSR